MDIRNASGQLIAVTRPQGGQEGVYDPRGSYLGYTDSRGTFDAQGRRVSFQAVPGLLVR